jgi:glycosyltransferase involved in cell wall biosynthesis
MIRAYQMVRADFPGLELRVVGRPQPRFANDPELPGLIDSPGVRLLGYLSEEELASQYSGAAAFCYPSLEEGFGLPILEAMGLGAPVLTSNLSCLPEVAGPSAVLVDPLSAPAIADGLREILRWTPAQKNEAVHSGREWAGRFSWKRAAGEYLNIYRQLLP